MTAKTKVLIDKIVLIECAGNGCGNCIFYNKDRFPCYGDITLRYTNETMNLISEKSQHDLEAFG